MDDVEITVASTEHADVVADLLYAFNREFDAPTPTAAQFSARFSTLLAREDVLVVLSGDPRDATGLAFCTLRPTPYYDGRLAQLEELYVRPGLRSRGIGTALLRAAIQVIRDRGGREVHINVDEVDSDARRFYERHEFVNVERAADGRMLCYLREL